MIDLRIRALHAALESRQPRLVDADPGLTRASVALIVRPSPRDLEILLIQRPTSERDPWSGHMALPGGRRQEGEAPLDTAIRETKEEVGIDLLSDGLLIGRLDDVHPSSGGPRIAVSPFVFAAAEEVVEVADPREVASAIWIPLTHLSDPVSAAHYLHVLPDGGTHRFPALSYNGHIIWGLTYRMLIQFLGVTRVAGRGGIA